jgi:hypothetical protein
VRDDLHEAMRACGYTLPTRPICVSLLLEAPRRMAPTIRRALSAPFAKAAK